MCQQCNYEELLSGVNLEATNHRVRVLEVVGNNRFPLSASDIYKILERSSTINRVTVYRILDLLVEQGVIERYEVTGRQLIIYLEDLASETPLRFSYRMRARFPMRAQTPPSGAYDYYNPAQSSVRAPIRMVVNE